MNSEKVEIAFLKSGYYKGIGLAWNTFVESFFIMLHAGQTIFYDFLGLRQMVKVKATGI